MKRSLLNRIILCGAGQYVLPVLALGLGMVLALFRNAIKDETIYLNDAAWMAECLRQGHWFGNEGVGLHGFIFKLPAALLFLCFGRSVFLATVTTVAMGAMAIWLTQRVLLRMLGSLKLAFAGTWLVLTAYHFVQCLPTFMRDIPALLAVLLLIEATVCRRGRWWVGFLLMLILDAKETTFFMIAPAFAVWVVLDEFGHSANDGARRLRTWGRIGGRWLAGFLFPLSYIVLMMCTEVVPLNLYLARVLGLTERWIGGVVSQFVSWDPAGTTVGRYRTLPRLHVPEGVWHWAGTILDNVVFYAGKLVHPKTFSIMTVSKVIIVPALAMSLRLFREWHRSRETYLLLLPLVVWTSLVEYLAGVTVGRYLLPVLPVIVYFFLRFILCLGERQYAVRVLAVTACALCLELLYELYMVPAKILIAFCPVLLLGAAAILSRREGVSANRLAVTAVLLLGGMGAAASLAASWSTASGQLGNYVRFGYNRDCERILSYIPANTRTWISCTEWSALPKFYRGERPGIEHAIHDVRPWIPRVKAMKNIEDFDRILTFADKVPDIERLRELVRRKKIEKLLAIISRTHRVKFMNQDLAETLLQEDWLEIERRVPAKNQDVYILSVKRPDRTADESQ